MTLEDVGFGGSDVVVGGSDVVVGGSEVVVWSLCFCFIQTP